MYSHHKKAEIIAKQSEMKSHLDDFCKGYVARNRTHENSAIISWMNKLQLNNQHIFDKISTMFSLSLPYGKMK